MGILHELLKHDSSSCHVCQNEKPAQIVKAMLLINFPKHNYSYRSMIKEKGKYKLSKTTGASK